MTVTDKMIETQARATSTAIARFAGIEDTRTVYSLVLAGMRELTREVRAAAPPESPAKAETPRESPAAPPSTHVVRFGRNANKLLGSLVDPDVRWYRDAIARAILEPEKRDFRDKNRQILQEIDAEISRRGTT